MRKITLILFAMLLTGALYAQHASTSKTVEHFEVTKRAFTRNVPRTLTNVPAEHFPQPGECRIWYPERSIGEQPPPMKYDELIGISLSEGAFILLHNGKAYDAEYDWKRDPHHEYTKERSGKIPQVIIHILYGYSRS